MTDPVNVLENMARVSNSIGVWTHYFDAQIIKANPVLERKFDFNPKLVSWHGRAIPHYQQHYLESLAVGGFCGGSKPFSYWLEKHDLLGVLQQLGYSVTVGADTPDHPNGPTILLYATRS
jgi:hypothetical protein